MSVEVSSVPFDGATAAGRLLPGRAPGRRRRSRGLVMGSLIGIGILAVLVAGVAAFLASSGQALIVLAGLTMLAALSFLALLLGLGSTSTEKRAASFAPDAFEALPEAMLVTSRSGRILFANRAAREAFEWDDTLPRGVDVLFEREGPSGAALYRLLQATRTGADGHEALRLNLPGAPAVTATVLPTGGRITQAVWRILDAGEETDVAATTAPAADVAPSGLEATGPQWTSFFDAAPMGMGRVTRDGRLVSANTAFAALTGLAAEAGASVLDAVAEADRGAVAAHLREALRKGAGGPYEVHLAGGERVVEMHVCPAPPDEGRGERRREILLYLIDATERLALQQQFTQSQKMQAIGQLAGGVAHDFNNLLTAIIGFCDLLLLRHQVGDPSFGDINQIRQNATRAANLTGQLLAFSRRQSLVPRILQLTEVLSDLTQLLRRLLGETVELKVEHARDLWPVKVDKVQFEQVIMNLAVNARDAMPGGGTLSIRTANLPAGDCHGLGHPMMPAADYVLIEVTDTGVGIPKENLEKVFDPFFTTKAAGAGTGLGLSTVYGIVKQTGGFIFPESTEGEGTAFRIYLPRHADLAETQEEAAEAPPRTQPDLTGRGTVLLVEDEDPVRTFAARALETRGYRVLSAASGESALALLREGEDTVELIISDVMMPKMDGPTLVREARALYPDLRVIFISGYAESAFRDSLAEPGNFTFLPKPFTLKQLAQAVKEALDRD